MNFFSDPVSFGLWILAILLSLSVHEFSHAAVAKLLGDDTAERAGRLTLNPLAHVDMVGMLMLVFAGFGWGRPVPIDERALRYQRFGPAFVAAAGPLSNLLFAAGIAFFGGGFLARFAGADTQLVEFFQMLLVMNLGLMLFNLIPIPPLDGSKWLYALLPDRLWGWKVFLESRGPLLLLGLLLVDRLFGGIIFGTFFAFAFRVIARLLALS